MDAVGRAGGSWAAGGGTAVRDGKRVRRGGCPDGRVPRDRGGLHVEPVWNDRAGTGDAGWTGSFSALLLPVLSSALTASGGVTSGGALYAGATLLISVLTSLIRSFLIPCVYCYFFLAVAQYAIGDDRLECLRELAGWTVKTALRAAVAAFTGVSDADGPARRGGG